MGNGALPHGPSYRAHPRLYRDPYIRVQGATGEPNGSSSVFVAGLFSRIGDGFQQNKFSCRSIVNEPRRLVDTAGLYTEPLHLASTQPSETARRNLRCGINKVRVNTHVNDAAQHIIL